MVRETGETRGQNHYFTGGWSKFCEDSRLAIGEFLVFWYGGRADVSVCGISACEREITSINNPVEDSDPDEAVNRAPVAEDLDVKVKGEDEDWDEPQDESDAGKIGRFSKILDRRESKFRRSPLSSLGLEKFSSSCPVIQTLAFTKLPPGSTHSSRSVLPRPTLLPTRKSFHPAVSANRNRYPPFRRGKDSTCTGHSLDFESCKCIILSPAFQPTSQNIWGCPAGFSTIQYLGKMSNLASIRFILRIIPIFILARLHPNLLPQEHDSELHQDRNLRPDY